MSKDDISLSSAQQKKIDFVLRGMDKSFSSGFESLTPSKNIVKKSQDLRKELDKARTLDIKVKIVLRIAYALFFGWLLTTQNIYVFNIIKESQKVGGLSEIQPLLAVVVPATLAETYFIVRIMVEWTFSDIDYKS